MISAVVLAAGKSSRMGQPKMVLPWGHTTVIGKVITTLMDAGLNNLHVVTGDNQISLENGLKGFPIEFVFNPDFAEGEMISSVQIGLKSLLVKSEAALIVLGDQPQIETHVVLAIMDSYLSTRSEIIVPSYQMHRGHPWLVDKSLWSEIFELKQTDTIQNFLRQHQEKINYISVNTPSIIQDIDTPEEYKLFSP